MPTTTDYVDFNLARLGLDDWPVVLHLANYGDRWGAYRHDDVRGLAAFSTVESAIRFHVEFLSDIPNLKPVCIVKARFDVARDIAKTRPCLNALMLLDDLDNPIIHYVR